MPTQVMKWFFIAALLMTLLCWNASANYQLELRLVICGAAAVVLTQAFISLLIVPFGMALAVLRPHESL